MVDAREELFDVAFEYPHGTGVVAPSLSRICEKLSEGFVRALPHPAGVGVGNKGAAKERIELAVERMVLPVLERVKQAYLLWHEYHSTLPKVHRYTIGEKIDTLFIEILEAISTAAFLSREKKVPYILLGLQKLNTLTLLLMILWETKSLRDKRYIALSLPLDEIGRMLNGWQGQLQKQNSPEAASRTREK